MNNSNNRNLILFVVLAMMIMIGYQFFVLDPAAKRRQAEQVQQKAAAEATTSRAGPLAAGDAIAPQNLNRDQAKAASPRIAIQTPSLSGSMSLLGGRIDDLYLTRFKETLVDGSPPVELLRPQGAARAYFAVFGWVGQNLPNLPGAGTQWTSAGGPSVLTPSQPVNLVFDNGAGLVFRRTVSVDERFMFTIKDSVTNATGAPVTLAPYASVQRQGLVQNKTAVGAFEGAIGALGEEGEEERHITRQFKYEDWKKRKEEAFRSVGGWLGVTDKYWLAAVIPDQGDSINAQFKVTPVGGVDIYEANFTADARQLAPGASVEHTTRLFAGAKQAPVLKDYEQALNIPRLEDAIDWGWSVLHLITKPMFLLLNWFYGLVGNFGVAILMLTVVMKAIFFYPANLSYESLTKMKKVQPQLEAIKAKHKEDPAAMQQAMMGLYKTEKINPLLGCLPMLATLPVFFALFHLLNVTIEMRHAPFFGWVQDLSARDPLSVWNLFGLIPWIPAETPVIGFILDNWLHLGPWAIAYGITMWLTQSMSPPAGDPIQQKIIMWMPVIFTFFLSQVAVGLMIYYTWSNLLTIVQQYIIMRRFKVETPIDRMLAFGRKAKT